MKREKLRRPLRERARNGKNPLHHLVVAVDHLRLYQEREKLFHKYVQRNLLKYDILTLFICPVIRKISHVCWPLNKSRAIHHNFLECAHTFFCLGDLIAVSIIRC